MSGNMKTFARTLNKNYPLRIITDLLGHSHKGGQWTCNEDFQRDQEIWKPRNYSAPIPWQSSATLNMWVTLGLLK